MSGWVFWITLSAFIVAEFNLGSEAAFGLALICASATRPEMAFGGLITAAVAFPRGVYGSIVPKPINRAVLTGSYGQGSEERLTPSGFSSWRCHGFPCRPWEALLVDAFALLLLLPAWDVVSCRYHENTSVI